MSELWALGATGALAALAEATRGAGNKPDSDARWIVQYLNPDGPGVWTRSSRPLPREEAEEELDAQRDAYPAIAHRLAPFTKTQEPKTERPDLTENILASQGDFRWRKVGAAEYVLERRDPNVRVTTRNVQDLMRRPVSGWRQLALVDIWSAYGSKWPRKFVLSLLEQSEDGSVRPSEPSNHSSPNRAARAAERRTGAPKMEISWR